MNYKKFRNRPKGIPTESGPSFGIGVVLSKLLQNMIHDLGFGSVDRWNFLMMKYINDPANEVKPDRRSQSSARGNLQKELSRSTMSWRVFVKGLRFLQIKKFTIIIKATSFTGNVTEHHQTVDLSLFSTQEPKESDE